MNKIIIKNTTLILELYWETAAMWGIKNLLATPVTMADRWWCSFNPAQWNQWLILTNFVEDCGTLEEV